MKILVFLETAMKLTFRQQAFFEKLSELYREAQKPVHYSVLAQSLGVNRFSAYDMLRVLENKGLVASEYRLPDKNSGPGRSSVVFYPIAKAREVLTRLAGDASEGREWERAKERILASLHHGRIDEDELLDELLSAIPQTSSPLAYCGRVIMALVLSIKTRLPVELEPGKMLKALANAEGGIAPGLNLLAGVAVGVTLTMKANQEVLDTLLEYARKYQRYLDKMDLDKRLELSRFLQEILQSVSPASSRGGRAA